MVDGQYKVSLEGEGLTLTRNVSKEVGEQILLLVVTGNVGTAKVLGPCGTGSTSGTQKRKCRRFGTDQDRRC